MPDLDYLRKLEQSVARHNAVLVAVSKTKSTGEIMQLYEMGHKTFGENRVAELVEKWTQLPKDISWHMIGHLQSNKVKQIASFVDLIHSVDSLKLIKQIDREAQQNDRTINFLLQLRIAREESKYGMGFEDLITLLDTGELKSFKNINVKGVMGMATLTTDREQITSEFKTLVSYFHEIKSSYYPQDNSFGEISMGMSGDYDLALNEGSTMIRVGSLIFGKRE